MYCVIHSLIYLFFCCLFPMHIVVSFNIDNDYRLKLANMAAGGFVVCYIYIYITGQLIRVVVRCASLADELTKARACSGITFKQMGLNKEKPSDPQCNTPKRLIFFVFFD